MSKQIDERVVSMKFDNAQFEKNVSTTLSTLEKLKQSLNLKGAAKGLEDIDYAAKKVDMNRLANGVETVGVKFNALYTIADQTLRNITTRAQHAAEQMVKSLTIQPISTGFNEYELKMGSIQTIMASTGEDLSTVNKYLNELNKYSDQTIYSFSDMTTNIGKFTNAGVKLEDAVLAIKGISNEAAVSGANANEASRAMYNFAQALSAGYVKLIDWKSIENANMATVEFKEQLLEAAVAAGTLEKQSNGMYKVLSRNAQGSTFEQLIDSTHYFNDSLNYQWMTTEALISTLKDYADETTEIGKKAYASAQDIKTFTQMMDTLKESAQSGWATTWELLVGDFEKAKKTWTTVGDVVGNVINDMSDSRNNLLKGALTSNWDKMIEKIAEAGVSSTELEERLRNVLKSHSLDVDTLIKKHGSLEQVFRKEAWGSTYLKEALSDVNTEFEDLSNIAETLKIGSTGKDVEKIQKALKEAGFQCGEFGKDLDGVDGKLGTVTRNAIIAFQKAHGLEADGIIGPKTLNSLEEANKKTSKFKDNIDSLIGSIDELGGRELLIEGLKNIFEAIADILDAVKKAWDNVFDGFKSKDLYDLIEKFHEFSETLVINEDVANNITGTFEGLFSILKFVKDVIVSVVSIGSKLIWTVFKPLAKVVLSATSAFGKWIKSSGDSISKVFKPMGKAIEGVIEFIGELVAALGDFVADGINKLSEFEWVQTLGEWFSNCADTVRNSIADITTYLGNLGGGKAKAVVGKIKEAFGSIGEWWDGFKISEDGMTIIDGIKAPFVALWDWITSFKLPKFDFNKTLQSVSKWFTYLQDNNFSGIGGTIVGTFKHIKSLLSFKWANFQGKSLQKVSDFYLKYGDDIKAGFEAIEEVFKSIIKFVFGVDELTIPAILDVAKKILEVVILLKTLTIVGGIANSISSVAEAFEQVGKGFNNIAKAMKWRAIGAAFLSIGGALIMFTICMKIIEDMDPEAASRSMRILLTALTMMGLIVGGLLFLSSKVTGSIDLVATTGALLAIAVSLAILVYTLKQIDNTEFKNLKSSFGILVGVLLSLTMVMALVGKTGGANLKTAAALAVMMGALKSVLGILDAYAEYDWDKAKSAIPKMIAVLFGLSLAFRLALGGIKAGANVSGLGFTILAMVISLRMLIGIISDFGKMPENELTQGLAAIMVVLAGITGVLAVINKTSKVTVVDKGQRAVSGFAGLATALLAVAVTIAILGSMPTDILVKGGIAVTAILGVFTAMLSILGKSMSGITGFGKITGMIIGMGAIIAELAIIMYLLRDLDGTDALAKFSGMALLLVAMAGCLRVLTKHQNGAKNIYKWIGAMFVFGLVVAELALVLKLIQGVDGVNAIAQFTAISIMLGVMGLTLENLTRHSRIKPANINKWVLAMGAFAIVVAGLAAILVGLNHFGVDGVNAIAQFTAISIMLIAISACLKILTTIGPLASAAYPAMGALAVFATGLVGFLSILGGIDKLFNGGFSDVMTRAVDIMTKIGQALGGLVGGVLEGIGKGLTAALPQMGKDLSDFMDSAGVFFSGLESFDASMVTNTGNMVAAITKLCALGVQNGTANVFTVGRSLPNLGADLSEFMKSAGGFFSGLSGINTDMSTSVKVVAEAIGILAEASLLDTITFGDGFASIGDKLVPFGEDLVEFSKTISGKIDTQAVEAAAAAAGVMAELNSKLPKEYGAISGLFASESIPLDTFGNQLVLFGKALVSFSHTVKGKIDADAVEAAAAAGTLMAELNSKLPKEYGAIAGLFTSESITLDTFGAQLVMFGRAMVGFSNTVSKGKIDAEAVETTKNAANIMSELATNLPKEHGAISSLFTSNSISLDTFGSQLVLFGRAMVSFSNTVKSGIDQGAIEAAATAGSVMNELAKNLPEETSWWDRWFGSGGTMTMEDFGSQLVKFGEAIVDFSQSMSGSVDAGVIKTTITAVNDLVDLSDNLPEEMDLSVLTTGLTDLSDAMIKFSESVSGNVDNETVAVVVNAAKTLAQAAALMPEQVDMAKLAVGLGDFGTAIVSFSGQVSGAVDGGSVTTATQAGKDIASMLATIPQGVDPTIFIDNLTKLGQALVDFSTKIAGSKDSPGINTTAMASAQTACDYLKNILISLSVYTDLTDFINNASLLAQAIVDFSAKVSAEGAINAEAISAASSAGTQIGSMLTSISVYTDITEFVNNATRLAQAIVDFSAKVSAEGAINTAAIATATTAGNQIAGLMASISIYSDISSFADNATKLANAIINFSTSVSDGSINIGAIDSALTAADHIRNVANAIGSIGDISDAISTVDKLGGTISTFATTVSESDMTGLGEDSEKFKEIVNSFGELSESGVEAFIENLSNARFKTTAAVSGFCSAMVMSIRPYATSFKMAGSYLVSGFASGITENTFKAKAAATAMALAALNSAKAALDVNSPSKEFYKVGAFAGEGFASAFSDYEPISSKAGSAMAKSALIGLGDAITAAKDIVENGIDAQPTIRPVLDLSGITADAAMISSLFDANPSVGVMANVGAISRGMAYGQNGSTNDDVINAINGLKDTLNQRTGDTYSIGSISYDDGTEVSNAIKTLVKAARVERRK